MKLIKIFFIANILLQASGENLMGQTPYDMYFSSAPSFHETFNYSDVTQMEASGKWVVGNCYGGRIRGENELQYYHNDNVLFDNGTLKLEAQERHGWGNLNVLNGQSWTEINPNDPANYREYDFTSGRITSNQEFQYGKFEAEIKIPGDKPFWPAYWLMGCGSGKNYEVDIFEFGESTNQVRFSYHDWNVKPHYGCSWLDTDNTNIDYSAGFHKFTLVWLPDRLVWFVDDIERRVVYSHEAGYPRGPIKINLNLAIGSNGTFEEEELPASMDVKYTKVFDLITPYSFNSFETVWSNDTIGYPYNWNNNYGDRFVSGNFNEADGKAELLCVSPFSNWAQIRYFEAKYWATEWSNAGSNYIGDWIIGTSDKYISGNFDGVNTRDELFCINSENSWSKLNTYNGNNWIQEWSNSGNNQIAYWVIGTPDKYVSGNFDGFDEKDELLCINPENGWAKVNKYNGNNWVQEWSNGGNDQIAYWVIGTTDKYLSGNFDGADEKDELLSINPGNGWAKVNKYNGTVWAQEWSNSGNDQIGSWNIDTSDRYIICDLDGNGKDELLCYNTLNGWSKIMSYNGQTWSQIWSNGGNFKLNNWNFIKEEIALSGNFLEGSKEQIFSIVYDNELTCPGYQNFLLKSPVLSRKKRISARSDEESINEKQATAINVYPNPSTNFVKIDLSVLQKEVNISIRDLAGKRLHQINYHNKEIITLNINHLEPGVYILQIDTGEAHEQVKLVKI